MRLNELRSILKDHEKSWGLLIHRNDDQIEKVKEFLEKFNNHDESYILSAKDIFSLLNTISLTSKSGLILSIKNRLSSNYFFEIYTTLNEAGLLTDHNFSLMYPLSYFPRYLLYGLFCDPSTEHISLTKEILATVLTIADEASAPQSNIEQVIRLLARKNLLTPPWLTMLRERKTEIFHSILIEELDKAGCLQEGILQSFDSMESLRPLNEVLKQLSTLKVPLNRTLFTLLCTKSQIFPGLLILLRLLIDTPIRLDTESITTLLNKDSLFFHHRKFVFTALKELACLDNDTFIKACNSETCSLNAIIEILAPQSLLTKELLIKMLNNEVNSDRIQRAIQYLDNSSLLDRNSLGLCTTAALRPHPDGFDKEVFDLLRCFDEYHFTLPKKRVAFLFTLSTANCNRLYWLTFDLYRAKLLNEQSFEQAVLRVTHKLPSVTAAALTKKSKKETQSPRSQLTLDGKLSFFIEAKESRYYPTIAKGYSTAKDDSPSYAIEKLRDSTPVAKKQALATRKVKYLRFLKHQAYYADAKKVVIVTDWLPGKALHKYDQSTLLQVPLLTRLQCLRSALMDLDTLHKYYRVHGDIKPANVILDVEQSSMKLINGSARKKDSTKIALHTLAYTDPAGWRGILGKDLYCMGMIIMCLFPELYTVIFTGNDVKMSINTSTFTLHEQIIVDLIQAMMHVKPQARCTSDDALNYCNEIITNFAKLDERILKEIANKTIHHSDVTVEDILHGTFKLCT